ncbi:hypothetical protein [Nonomuraea turcica]|uniref:hypothetical protein n=1 Tax=Nonomuraea sp. G32 TaxID=3067274 RepID=UPI00273B9C95|nr:hypothetical protein [Nonomuraea sp. G32]MDP4501061.1 hypothetical protein [Nonomuraea sp. G32]
MSSCCGQGPVIISGAPAPPRVDVEAVVLCDVLADGTVAGVALVEPIYDTTSGDRIGTRTVDPVSGAAYVPAGTLRPCSPDGCNATTTAQVLCDVQADGTAVQFVRATTYDCEGALLATLDRTLDGAAYTVTGTVEVCPTVPDCEQPTTPTATVGLCLSDGTPIAVTVVRDCEGVVTSEGWINLVTGAFSAGAPPAGTVACGDSRSIEVSGVFCDLDPDGTVLGLVLIEYSYAADGSIDSVRLVDATTGATYTPQGEISVCPAGVGQPEQDVVQLCDVAADGSVTPFIRDYRRDENGAIVGRSDYTLDGAAYAPTGTVGACQAAEACLHCETLPMCDVGPAQQVTLDRTLTDTDPTPYFQASDNLWKVPLPGGGQAFWDGGQLVWPEGTAPPPQQTNQQQHHYIAALIQGAPVVPPCPAADPPTEVTITATAHVVNDGPTFAYSTAGVLRLLQGGTQLAANPVFNIQVGGARDFTLTHTVTYEQWLSGELAIELDLETYTQGGKGWTSSAFTLAATANVTSCSTPFLRTICRDCSGEIISTTDTTLDGAAYTPVGPISPGACEVGEDSPACAEVAVVPLCDVQADTTVPFLRHVQHDCSGAVTRIWDTDLDGGDFLASGEVTVCGGQEPGCAKQIIERCGCDTTATGEVIPYTELWAVDPCNGEAPVLLGAYRDGDLTQPYTPVNPGECPASMEEPEPLLTGVRRLTGDEVLNLSGLHPGIQSVTLTVLAGQGTVTTDDGTETIPAGVTLSWSVSKDSDQALTTWSGGSLGTGSDVLLHYTYRG